GASGSEIPKIQPFFFPKNLTTGKTVKVICNPSEGSLPFTFEWLKDGTQVVPSAHVAVKTHEDYSLLNIDSVGWEDAGNYSCVLNNSAGSDTHTATLSVFA
uniref:Dscam n=1 Tax=Chelicerata TaxID=6843 RepID=UPI0024B877E3|nr:Chain A, Dscam [Chelicerata]7Y95_B Chain B, Dscam [Chelicerata]